MFACIRRLSFVCLGVASSSHVRGMLLVRQCGRAALKEKLIMQNSHLTRLEAFASADARFCHMCGLQREQETQAWHGLHVLVCRRSARLKGFEQAGFFLPSTTCFPNNCSSLACTHGVTLETLSRGATDQDQEEGQEHGRSVATPEKKCRAHRAATVLL